MRKNEAGQVYSFVARQTDNTAITTGVSGSRILDNGTSAAITGTLTHKGTGWWTYSSSAADTNGDFVSLRFTATDMVEVVFNFDTRIPRTDVRYWAGVPQTIGATGKAAVDILTQQVADGMRIAPTGTVNSDSVDDKLDTILTSIANTVPTEKTRDSDVLTTGTQTGTSANTLARDGTYWQITSVAAGLNAELVFNIGTADENPSSVQLFGRFDSGRNRQTVVQGFNFSINAWEKLGQDVLSDENSDKDYIWGLGRSFVRRGQAGTPGVDGDVRIRFLYDTSVSNKVQAGDNLYLDKVAVYYTSEVITLGEIVDALIRANPNRNYPDSAIVISSDNGQPGTQFGVNGTPGLPVSNLSDAIVLASTGGFTKFIVNGNTNLVLTQAFPDWTFILAQGSVIDMNGQDVDNSTFIGGTIQGTTVAATTGIRAAGCTLKGVTSWGLFEACNLPAADSLIANGNQVYLLNCESTRPGLANPSIKGGAVAGLSLSVIKYGGGLDVSGLANDANVTLSGTGSFALTDAATTATVIISGNARYIGSLPTGINVTETARVTQATPMNMGQINGKDTAAVRLQKSIDTVAYGTAGAGSTTTAIGVASIDPAIVGSNYQDLTVKFTEDTATAALRGQGQQIASSAPGQLLLKGSLTTAPASGDTFVIN